MKVLNFASLSGKHGGRATANHNVRKTLYVKLGEAGGGIVDVPGDVQGDVTTLDHAIIRSFITISELISGTLG